MIGLVVTVGIVILLTPLAAMLAEQARRSDWQVGATPRPGSGLESRSHFKWWLKNNPQPGYLVYVLLQVVDCDSTRVTVKRVGPRYRQWRQLRRHQVHNWDQVKDSLRPGAELLLHIPRYIAIEKGLIDEPG